LNVAHADTAAQLKLIACASFGVSLG